MTEGGIYTQYNAVTASAGVVPTWVLQQTLNTNTGALTVAGGISATGAFGTFQTGGALTGALNGSNQTYTLPQIPKQLPLILINGLGATNTVEYTLSGATLTHIGTALGSGETITFAGYQY